MIRPSLIALAFLLSPVVQAEGWTVHTVSMHYQDGGQYNNINPGVAYDVMKYARVGAVINSYYRLSTYAAAIMPVSDKLRIGVGMVTGYRPGAVPLISVEYDIRPGLSIVWFGTALNMEIKF